MPCLIFLILLHSVLALPTIPYTEQTVLAQSDLDSEPQGWLDPRPNGGRFLDVRNFNLNFILLNANLNIPKYTTHKFGEPLNVIISALSDPFILTENGFHYYTKYVFWTCNLYLF